MGLLIFISHSGEDSLTAEAVVKLLRSALNLSPDDIRCTSVDGHRLPAGADTDEQLRGELLDAQVLLGIISHHGMSSAYVLFELGARWGARKPLMPLLAPTVGPEILRGPITGLNALRLDSEEQLHQLVRDVASSLGRQVNATSAFLAELRNVISSGISRNTARAQAVRETEPAVDLNDDGLAVIRMLAQSDHDREYYTTIADNLGWNKVKTQHVIDNLAEAGYLEMLMLYYGPGYGLTRKGRALAVNSGFTEVD